MIYSKPLPDVPIDQADIVDDYPLLPCRVILVKSPLSVTTWDKMTAVGAVSHVG